MDNITSRLKKINGQVTGLQKMIQEKKDCEKIVIQFQAVKQAVNSAFTCLLSEQMSLCVKNKTPKKMEKLLQLIVKQKN